MQPGPSEIRRFYATETTSQLGGGEVDLAFLRSRLSPSPSAKLYSLAALQAAALDGASSYPGHWPAAAALGWGSLGPLGRSQGHGLRFRNKCLAPSTGAPKTGICHRCSKAIQRILLADCPSCGSLHPRISAWHPAPPAPGTTAPSTATRRRRGLGACLGKRRKRELDDRDGRLDDGERDASVPRGRGRHLSAGGRRSRPTAAFAAAASSRSRSAARDRGEPVAVRRERRRDHRESGRVLGEAGPVLHESGPVLHEPGPVLHEPGRVHREPRPFHRDPSRDHDETAAPAAALLAPRGGRFDSRGSLHAPRRVRFDPGRR